MSDADSDSVAVEIYASDTRPGTYIYLRENVSLEDLDQGLRKLLGRVRHVMPLELHPERNLAQAKVIDVMQQVRAEGFYLQLPPPDLTGPVGESDP